jgi:hypothetical protein
MHATVSHEYRRMVGVRMGTRMGCTTHGRLCTARRPRSSSSLVGPWGFKAPATATATWAWHARFAHVRDARSTTCVGHDRRSRTLEHSTRTREAQTDRRRFPGSQHTHTRSPKLTGGSLGPYSHNPSGKGIRACSVRAAAPVRIYVLSESSARAVRIHTAACWICCVRRSS